MNINDNGLNIITKENIKIDIENALKLLFGEKFYIKDKGIIDSFVKIISDMEISFQNNILSIIKNFNPDTANGIWQDALYERIGVKRLDSKKTTFSIEIISDGESSIKAGDIHIQTINGSKEFKNLSDFITNSNGHTVVDFVAIKYGDIEVSSSDEFQIVSAPVSILNINNNSINHIEIGRKRESDEDFRLRFKTSKALNSKATNFANISNLNKFVDYDNYLKIVDKKTDNTYSPMEVKVIAKHNTTDNIFAKAIFETFGFGVKFLGNTEINLKDLRGDNVKVKFQNADEIDLYIDINLEFENEVYKPEISQLIKSNIVNYVLEKNYGLGNVIYATELIIPIISTKGVKNVNTIKIRKNNEGESVDVINLDISELPHFSESYITIREEI